MAPTLTKCSPRVWQRVPRKKRRRRSARRAGRHRFIVRRPGASRPCASSCSPPARARPPWIVASRTGAPRCTRPPPQRAWRGEAARHVQSPRARCWWPGAPTKRPSTGAARPRPRWRKVKRWWPGLKGGAGGILEPLTQGQYRPPHQHQRSHQFRRRRSPQRPRQFPRCRRRHQRCRHHRPRRALRVDAGRWPSLVQNAALASSVSPAHAPDAARRYCPFRRLRLSPASLQGKASRAIRGCRGRSTCRTQAWYSKVPVDRLGPCAVYPEIAPGIHFERSRNLDPEVCRRGMLKERYTRCPRKNTYVQ